MSSFPYKPLSHDVDSEWLLLGYLQGPRLIEIDGRSRVQNACPTTGPIVNRSSTSFFSSIETSLETSAFLHPGNESSAK